MNTTLFFVVQVALNALVFVLIALWYVAPRLARLPRARALAPLLFLSAFRSEGTVFLISGVVGSRLTEQFATPAAYGDLLAAVLAVAALLLLRARWRGALVFVWLFNIEGTFDLLNAIFQGVRANVPVQPLGPGWFILTLYVPALLVAHLVIFWVLLRREHPLGVNATSPDKLETLVTIESR